MMQLKLMTLFGRRPSTDEDEDVEVDYDPAEDLVDAAPVRPTKVARGRGRRLADGGWPGRDRG